MQPSRMFEFFDNVLGEGQARIHTAGLLDEGRRLWILAKLAGADIRVKRSDDIIEKYLLLATGFDGSLNLTGFFTPTRVVCQNTLNAALRGEKSNCVKIRHTQNAVNKLEEAARTMKASIEFYGEFETKVQYLASSRMSDAQTDDAIHIMFGCDSDEKKAEASTRTKNLIGKVKALTQVGSGNKQWEGTAWGVYNAATEYADHHMVVRGARGEDETQRTVEAKDKILMSVWFGAAADFKAKAINAIDTVLAR
jgi:phage/plasmid-like protein (TIGR03299 family)